jgi:uncharacterized lipoprotein
MTTFSRSQAGAIALLLAALALASASCSRGKSKLEKCHKQQEYQAAQVGPRVRTPDDLNDLNDQARLPVPFGETHTEPTAADQPCLINPPDYTDRQS